MLFRISAITCMSLCICVVFAAIATAQQIQGDARTQTGQQPVQDKAHDGQAYDTGPTHHSVYHHGGFHRGPVYTLYHDAYGREFICVNGRRVYFDDQQTQDARHAGRDDDDTVDGPPPPPGQEYQADRPVIEDQRAPTEAFDDRQADPGSPPAPPQPPVPVPVDQLDQPATRGELEGPSQVEAEAEDRVDVDDSQERSIRGEQDAAVEADAEASTETEADDDLFRADTETETATEAAEAEVDTETAEEE